MTAATHPTLKSKVSVAWPPFEKTLAAVIEGLVEDQYLILLVKQSNRYIQFAAQGAFGIRVETTSNHYLSKQEKLDERQIAALSEAGWQVPTGKPNESTPENDPDGSPNFYAEFAAPVSLEAVARLTVRTFAEILRVPHPGFLQYEAFEDVEGEWTALALPGLGLKQAKPKQPGDNLASLAEALLTTLKIETGIGKLDFDCDGDIGIRYGSAAVFVRLISDPPRIRFYSPILRNVEETPVIYSKLNDFNASATLIRFYYQNGLIYGAADIAAVPYVDKHVIQTFVHFCEMVDGMDSLLQAEFGGGTVFAESMPSLMRH